MLDEVSEELGVTLEGEEFDTFSGFVLHAVGSIPEDGTVIELTVAGIHIREAKIINHQVERAVVSMI